MLCSKYDEIEWTNVANSQLVELEHDLINALREVNFGIFLNTCLAGDDCTFDHYPRSSNEAGKGLIDLLNLRYRVGKVKIFVVKLLGRPYIERRIRADTDQFNKEMEKALAKH